MTELKITSLEDLSFVGEKFLSLTSGRKIFAFDAEMGAGKTTFILQLLKILGINDPEGSPTYSLVNSYHLPDGKEVYHMDLYRLKNESEAYDIGIEEMIYGDAICFIEWPEKIADLLPDDTIWSYIRKNEDNSRTLIIDL